MKISELQKKLLAAARANPPSDRVPYAFEKRIMAHLTAPLPLDSWTLWSRALWRAAAPCVAIMLLLGVCTLALPPAPEVTEDLDHALESAVVNAPDHLADLR